MNTKEHQINLDTQIDKLLNSNNHNPDTITLAYKNEILTTLGYKFDELTLDKTHLRYILEENYYYNKNSQGITNKRDLELIKQNSDGHYLGKEFLTLLPDLLERPIAIITPNNHEEDRQLVFLDYKLHGSYVCLALQPNGAGTKNGKRFSSTHIVSIYAKRNAETIIYRELQNELNVLNGNQRKDAHYLYYIDYNKAYEIITETINKKTIKRDDKNALSFRRSFINGCINTIQGQSLIVKENVQKSEEKSQNHKITNFEVSGKSQNLRFSPTMSNQDNPTFQTPPLKEQIEKYKNYTLNRSDTFTVAYMNPLFDALGYSYKEFTLDKKHLRYCINEDYYTKVNSDDDIQNLKERAKDHALGEEFLYSLPSLLEHPIAVMSSNTKGENRQLVILDYKHNGKYVIMALDPMGYGMKNGILFPTTQVFSIYARENVDFLLYKEIQNEMYAQNGGYRKDGHYVYYVDNKRAKEILIDYENKKTNETLNSKDYQLSRLFNLNGLVNTIQGQSLIVKENVQKSEEKSQNHKFTNFEVSGKSQNLRFSDIARANLREEDMERTDLNSYLNKEVENVNSENKLSELLFTSTIAERLNNMGVRTYVINNGKRRSLEWEVKKDENADLLLTLSDKKYYGFVHKDAIYLTKDGINPSVLLHEYAHLWLEVYRLSTSKQEWNNFKAEVLSSPMFLNASKKYDSEVYNTKDDKFTEFVCDYISHSALSGNELSSLCNDTINTTLTTVFEETLESDKNGLPKLKNLTNLCIKDLITSADLFKEFNKEKLDTLFALKVEYEISEKKEEEMRNGIRNKLTSYSDNKINETITSIKTLVKEAKDEHKTKVAKLAYKWVLDGSLILPEDTDKFKNAFNVAETGHIDPFRYTSPVLLLEENTNVILKEPPIDPDTIPTLTNKKVYDYGITIYDVEESDASRENMRRIINTHLGKNSSPWCILQGDKDGNLTEGSKYYWRSYNGVKKRVAFINGKLAYFRASSRGEAWWDTQDIDHKYIQIEQKVPGDPLERIGKYNFDLKTKALQATPLFMFKRTKDEYSVWNPITGKKIKEVLYQNGVRVNLKEWEETLGYLITNDKFNPITGKAEETRSYAPHSSSDDPNLQYLQSYYIFKPDCRYSVVWEWTSHNVSYITYDLLKPNSNILQVSKDVNHRDSEEKGFYPSITVEYFTSPERKRTNKMHIEAVDFASSSPIYYLSGPISSNPNAIHTFYQADGELLRRYMKTVNPLDIVRQIKGFDDLTPEEQWKVAMERDLEELKKADVLVALPRNGLESKGADIEERVARENGIPVVPYETLERNNFNIMQTLKELEGTATTSSVISANTVLGASDFKQGHIALDEYALTNTIANLLEKVGIKTEVISSDKLLSFAENRIRQTTNNDTLIYKTLSTYEVYGCTSGKTIYLKEGAIRSDVLLHEYAHLWLEAFRLSSAEKWEEISETLLKDPNIASSLYKYSPHLTPNTTDGRLVEYICDTIATNGKNLTFDNILKSDLETLFKCESADETLKNLSSLAIKDLVNSSPLLKNANIPENIYFFDSEERTLFDGANGSETPSDEDEKENEKDSSLLEEKLKVNEYEYIPEHDTFLEEKLADKYDKDRVKAYDYTKVRADKLVLFSKKTIIDKPYPSYLPPLKGITLSNTIYDKFRIPAAPLPDGNLLIEDRYSSIDPITKETSSKLDYYKVSLDVYASLKNYLITYFNALEEKRIEHNINEINKQLDELEKKYQSNEQFKDFNVSSLYYEKTEGSSVDFYKTKITTTNGVLPSLDLIRINADNLITSYPRDPFDKTYKNVKDIKPQYSRRGTIDLYPTDDHDGFLTFGISASDRFVSPTHYTSRLKKRRMDSDTYNFIEGIGQKFTGEIPTNPEIFDFWNKLQKDTAQRLLDMDVQETSILSSYAKGKETSYGDGGTKDTLYNDYGVLVKRQNGDEINTTEQKEINDVLSHVYSLYGNLSNVAKDHSLKISHAGRLHQHASKAIGIWTPQFGTIGISFIGGDEKQAKSTGIHEFAHFLDRTKGEQTNHWYNSDIVGSREQIIAAEFRKKTHPSGKYWSSTKECFARCMELYASAHDFVKKNNYTIEQLKTPGDERKKYFDEFNKEYNYPQEDYESRTGNFATMFYYINYDNDNPCLYELCSDYITSLRQEFHIEPFQEKTTNLTTSESREFVISENTENVAPATTTTTVENTPTTVENTPSTTGSFLTLTNDEIHALSESIKNKTDFVINNPNLDKPIHLTWGSMGDIRETVHGIGGFGLEHFIQRRYESDKKTEDELTASILLIANAVKTATPEEHKDRITKKALRQNGLYLSIDGAKSENLEEADNKYTFLTGFIDGSSNDIKKEGKVAIQTVIAQYGFTQDFSSVRNQVVALITSVNTIRQTHPIVNDIYEKKSKKVIFVLGNVFKSEEKERFESEIEKIQRNAEASGEKVKVINAYEIMENIPMLDTLKYKAKVSNIISAFNKELKKGNITEIVNISNSEKTKVETEIEAFATRHSIAYSELYERVDTRLENTTPEQQASEEKTTKFEILENTNSQNHKITNFVISTEESATMSHDDTENHKITNFVETKITNSEDEKTTKSVISGNNDNEPKTMEVNMDEEKKESEVNDLNVSEKQALDIREKVREILTKNDANITREDRVILRQYEGVGGIKEEDATVEGALSEFYTPTPIVKKMWELMDAYNPDAYEVLEPSCGRGRFLDGRSDNHFTAYECDDTSSRIAKILFPNADIRHDYWQSQFLKSRSLRKDLVNTLEGLTIPQDDKNYKQYDAVIGNPPYGQIRDKFSAFWRIYDNSSTYPDYFIKQGLANLKAGGFLAFIVPSSLQDKIKKDIKKFDEEIFSSYYQQAEINLLMRAGTYSHLTSALINSRLVDAYRLPEGMFPSTKIGTDILIFRKESVKTWDYFYSLNPEEKKREGEFFYNNVKEAGEFFERHPDHVLGVEKTRKNRHGMEETFVDFANDETKEDVLARITPMKELIRERTREVIKGKYEVDKTTGEVEEIPKSKIVKPAKEPTWAKAQTGHTMSEEEFAQKYGIDKNISPYDKEIWKATKYDGSVDTDKLTPTALSYLQNDKTKYIEVEKDNYYLKALYTTGNIYTKLDDLEQSLKLGEIDTSHYDECKKALTENIPEKIKIEDIHFSPLTQFAREFKVTRELEAAKYERRSVGQEYSRHYGRYYDRGEYETVYTTSSSEIDLRKAFIHWALNDNNTSRGYKYNYNETIANVKPEDLKTENNIIKWEHVCEYLEGVGVPTGVTKDDSKEVKIQKEARALSFKQDRRDVAERLFDRFLHEGLSEDEKNKLVEEYNRTFNAVVEPDYNKLPVYVSGMHTHKRGNDKDREFTMHPVQLRGASFLSAKGSGLLAYDVGVGKTTTGIVATVMQLQSGRAKRPLIIVPKAVYKKWWEDLHQHFPDIEVNDLDNLDEAHSVKFLNGDHSLNIKEGTISLMSYQGLVDHISFTDESIDKNGILANDLQEILSIKMSGTNREKSLELQKLNSRYGTLITTRDENYAFWERTGFDHITVDEAHNFKNLFTIPRAERGESPEYEELQGGKASQRALKLYAACQLVQANNNDRNVFLLTATPFTNHPFEVFSMLSFMGRKRLKELQVNSVKAFADKFAITKSEWGVNSTGNIDYMVSMKEWRSLKELQSILHEYFDRVTAEEAGIKRPNKTVISPLLDITDQQRKISRECEESIIGNSKDSGNKGDILKAINDMRKNILSPALVSSEYSSPLTQFVEVSPKVKLCLDTVIKVYKGYPQGGQVIYCNLKEGFEYMKSYLIKNGIPEKAIGIFEGGKSKSAESRQKDIENFNNPEKPLKIIIGTSTIKEGVDLNGNSVALWNLTLDWNPSDITQVEGRAWRQGNRQTNVNVIYPLAYNSVDAFMYQKYDEKSSRINELFSYKGTSLKVEDINPFEMKYSLITDPDKRSKLIIDDKIKAIEMAIGGYESEKEKYLKLINDMSREEDMKKEYEENKARYEARDKEDASPNIQAEYIRLKNKLTEQKRTLDKIQKAKDHLKTYSVEVAYKNIDEINARIQKKKEEEVDVHRQEKEIIEQVKEEIARTKAPTKTVEEYSNEIAEQILNNVNLNITSLLSQSAESVQQPQEQQQENSTLFDTPTPEPGNTNDTNGGTPPVSAPLTMQEEEKITNSVISENQETTNFVISTNENTPEQTEEPKEEQQTEALTLDEAVKRYGLAYNKKQMLANKDQLFFAFLVAKNGEIYEGNKQVGMALYDTLKSRGVDIHLVSDRGIATLEKGLKKQYGSIMDNSVVYGYESDGAIYINENRISANAILHEYTHLWTHSIMTANPLLWEKIQKTVMGTELFREMYLDPRYDDIKDNLSALTSETLSRLSADANVRAIEDRLSKFKTIKDDERAQYALGDTYDWVAENVFKDRKHELDLNEITTRVLGDILKTKDVEKIKTGYTFDSYTANIFDKDRALDEGYKKLKDIMLEQLFQLRPYMSEELKAKYREHYDSLVDKSPKEACEILSRKIEENAVAYRFFKDLISDKYPDETFQNHILGCFKRNSEEDFQSAVETGMKLDRVAGILDTTRSNIYLHFVNTVALDYLKNDNPITKQLLTDFIASEGKEALRMLYIISGDNMDYKMKIRSLLPVITYTDEKGQTHTKAETFGILDYDKNMLLSSEYNTTYVGNPTNNIQSDLTLDERAITLSEEFARVFGNVNRYEELKALRDEGASDEEINKLEWREKLYMSDKNEVKRCAINAILEGYTIDTLYEQSEVVEELKRLRDENEKVFKAIREEEERAMSDDKAYEKSEVATEEEQNTPILNKDALHEFYESLEKETEEEDKQLSDKYMEVSRPLSSLEPIEEKQQDKLQQIKPQTPIMTWQERQEQVMKEREEAKVKASENANKFYGWTSKNELPQNVAYLKEHGLDNSIAQNNGVHYNTKYESLQVPLYSNKTDKLVNLQTIKCDRNENGKWSKYFLAGSDTNVHATLGEQKSPIVFVAEGWATAGAVNKNINELTYASMSAGNLKNTVDFVKQKHPDCFVVVIADNDRKRETENVMGIGEQKAYESKANAVITIPTLGEDAADYALKNDLKKLIVSSLAQNKDYQAFMHKVIQQQNSKKQNNEQTIQIA